MKYRADIDGLRAVAVIAVILYHARLLFPGGYVGVDVFFVISGFLITSILLKNLRDDTFSYLEFWARRVRRLVPALFLVTVFTAIMSYFILLPADLVDLSGALIAQPLLLANVYFWGVVKGGYFGDPPDMRPLLHTWSLGVEEQFYLFFPVFLMFCWRSPRLQPHLGKVLLATASFSFALSVLLTPNNGVTAFFSLPTRAWELLIGGLLIFIPEVPKRFRESFSWLGTALILYSFFSFHKETPFPGTAALVPCLGTALIIVSNEVGSLTRVGRMLSNPYMVRIGLASYSLYLWHWPLMAFGEYTGLAHPKGVRILLVLLSFWAGFLSWKFVETPSRGARWLQTRRSGLILFLSYVVVCGSLGLYFRVNEGFKENWNKSALSIYEPRMDFRSFLHEVDLGSPKPQLREIGDIARSQVDFLLWGDSHAMSLAAAFDELGREYGVKGVMLTRTITPPLVSWSLSGDTEVENSWRALMLRTVHEKQVPLVFMHATWSIYDSKSFPEDFRETIALIEKVGATPHVVSSTLNIKGPLLHTPYRFEPIITRWPLLKSLTRPTRLETQEEYEKRNQQLFEVAKSDPRVTILNPAKLQFDWSSLNPNGVPAYRDSGHLTDFGARRLRGCFESIFESLVRNREQETVQTGLSEGS